MPDLAQHGRTGDIMDAREVAAAPELIPGPWHCPGCDVAMTPVACGPCNYEVSPHFRANGKHDPECRYDGQHFDAKPGEIRRIKRSMSMGPPESMPTRLRLAERRPQRREPDRTNPDDQPVHAYRGRPDANDAPSTHESTASMLHRIADAYCCYPLERSRRLRIPECAGRTYADCFRQLKNTTGTGAFDYIVLFAPIRFQTPAVRDHTMTIQLGPAHWKAPYDPNAPTSPDAVYRVSFLTGTWRDRDRNRFRYKLLEAIDDQRRDHGDKDETWRTYLFVLGRQDPRDPALFNVEDHRLTCFFRLHKTVYLQL